jgi:hypothetical protein
MTGDLDLLVDRSPENAKHIVDALAAFGFGDLKLRPTDFEQPDVVIQLGVAPVRVDILTSISGVEWNEAWAGRVAGELGAVPAAFLGLAEFRKNKRAVGRHQDLADLEALGDE